MSKDQEIDLSTTAASNTDFGGVNVGEGMAPSNVNNAMRYLAKMRADAITRHVAKSAGSYTALKTDHNQFWRCTAAVTINLTAAATLSNGWCLWVRANGGAVTIDPNGAETIDGAATLALADGQQTLIMCTGTALFSIVGGAAAGEVQLPTGPAPTPTREGSVAWDSDDDHLVAGDGSGTLKPGKPVTMQEFTASGTWTKPAGCRRIAIEAVGGGGGGGGIDGQGAGTGCAAAGGGSGAYGRTNLINVANISSATITIGAAGTGGAAGNTAGSAGGDTVWSDGSNAFTWGGGGGGPGSIGSANAISRSGGDAGIGTSVNAGGQSGGPSWSDPNNNTGGQGGSSPFGRGGLANQGAGGAATAGNSGSGYGAGGSGGVARGVATNVAGGNGTAGYIRVLEFY